MQGGGWGAPVRSCSADTRETMQWVQASSNQKATAFGEQNWGLQNTPGQRGDFCSQSPKPSPGYGVPPATGTILGTPIPPGYLHRDAPSPWQTVPPAAAALQLPILTIPAHSCPSLPIPAPHQEPAGPQDAHLQPELFIGAELGHTEGLSHLLSSYFICQTDA